MKRNQIAILSVALFFILLVAASCDLLGVHIFDNIDKGNITITLATSTSAKTLEPSISLDVAKYDIEAIGPGEAHFEVGDFEGSTYSKADLAPGTWIITATGKNADGIDIAVDSETVTVIAAKTVAASLLCLPISGDGFLAITLDWPAGLVTVPEVQAILTPDAGGDPIDLSFTESDGSASYPSAARANGYYTLNIKLKERDVGKTVWSWTETVLIVAGHATTGHWTLTENDMNIVQEGGMDVQIASDTKKPIVVSLVGTQSELAIGNSMNVTASGDPIAASWRWYLDGDLVDGATGSNITIGSALAGGSHSLVAVARKEGISGSAGFRFRVIPVESRYSKSAAWSGYYWTQDNPYAMITDATAPHASLAAAWSVAGLGNYAPCMLTGDVAGDGKLETVVSVNGVAKVFSSAGALLSSFALPAANQQIQLLADIDGDSKADLLCGCGSGNTTLRAFGYDGNLKKTFQGPAPGDSGIYPIKVADGKLYANMTTGFSLQPRGILRFDVASEAQDWFFSVGVAPTYSALAFDCDDDGDLEITIGNGTVHNGSTGSGYNGNATTTDDGSTWMIIVNSDGTPQLIARPDDSHIDGEILLYFYDYGNDGTMQMLACNEHPTPYYNGTDQIRVVDISSGTTLKTVDIGTDQWYWTPIFDGTTVYAVVPASHTIQVYDSSLNLVSSTSAVNFKSVCFLNDIDGDGAKELGVSDDTSIIMLDTSTWQAKYTIPVSGTFKQAIVSDIDGEGKNEILVYDGGLTVYGKD